MVSNNRYAIREDDMSNLADSVRWRTGTFDKKYIPQMIGEMNKNYFLNREQTTEIRPGADGWTRPSGWPDLDSLNLQMSGDDFIYMTYDATGTGNAIAWHLETANSQPATLEVGHITNGEYIADETYSVTHNTNFSRWTDDLSGYLVIRITGQITRCISYNVTRNGVTQFNLQQPILERIAYVPHLIHFTNGTTYHWGTYSLQREKVANGDGTALTSLYYAWDNCVSLESLDISGLYTQNVTNFNNVFYRCLGLTSLNLSHWNTEKATIMAGMFSECRALKTLNITGFVTSNVTTMLSMFSGCRSLTNIDYISTFDTAKVTTFSSMFSSCYNVKNLPVDDFNVSNATSFSSMFYECYAISELDLSKWRPVKATNISSMFTSCYTLKRINFDGWTTATLTTISSLFSGCRNLQNIDISWLHVTSSCTSIYNAFNSMWSIKEINIPNDWDVSGLLSNSNNASGIFSGCYSLERITGIKDWQFYITYTLTGIFSNCYCLKELDVSGWKVDTVTNTSTMFQNCYCLQELDLSNWNPKNSTNFANMFSGCLSLKSIGDISEWDVDKCTNFTSMFADCYSLTEFPDISNWDFSAATAVGSMFTGMLSITEINLPNMSFPNVTSIATMFRYCYNLRKINISGWSVPKLNTAPAQLLSDCWNLKEIDVFPISLNHSYTNDFCLGHDEIVKILRSLPAVTGTKTINIMTQNINRLTVEEKAIATNKGWTLAN